MQLALLNCSLFNTAGLTTSFINAQFANMVAITTKALLTPPLCPPPNHPHSTDNLDFVKERATKTLFKLLAAKPEGEQVSRRGDQHTAGGGALRKGCWPLAKNLLGRATTLPT